MPRDRRTTIVRWRHGRSGSGVAEQRIAAALAAGGTVVDDSQAPSHTVIADQDGNKACVCTTLPPAQKTVTG